MAKRNKIIFEFKVGSIKVRKKAVPPNKIIQPKKGGKYNRKDNYEEN